jgi:glyoxylase-like metal-dependent hydrolase (beta-lactamase superfamily II)
MPINRRAFLADLGKGVTGAVVLAACSSESTSDPTTPSASSTTIAAAAPSTSASTTVTTSSASTTASSLWDWARVDLGFVSAYVLVRDGEAVIVDTGVAGSEGAIESVLGELGLAWNAVAHVIITHEHPDHQGSAQAVLEFTSDATGHAAQPDLGNIATPRALNEVRDGDLVEGLRVIATPGHTAGHISILDPGRILLSGDAINNIDGELTGPNPQFSSDMAIGVESVRLLAAFDYEVTLFGHGTPIESRASVAVTDLAQSL